MTAQYQYFDTYPVSAPVETAQAVEVGDLVGLSTGNVVRAEDETWDADLGTTQAAFVSKFLGVSSQRKVADVARIYGNAVANRIRVATGGVYEFSCASASFKVGDLVGPAKQTGDALESQKVVAVATEDLAIGRVEEATSSATTVKVRLLSVKSPLARQTPAPDIDLGDDVSLAFGDGADAVALWSTGDASNHAFVLGLGDTNQSLHVTDKDAADSDWNVSAETHPTVFIHSNTTPTTDYLAIGRHDGTSCYIDAAGATNLILGHAGLETVILKTASGAINEVTVTPAAIGVAPSIKSSGGDTHVTLEIGVKGTTSVVQVTGPLTDKRTQTATTDTATLTIAQLLTKVIDGTPTGAATYTLPTAANLVAGITNCKVGDSFEFLVNNKAAGADTITLQAGSGGTADGTLTVAQNVIRKFMVIVTNVTGSSEAYFVYGIG